MHRYLLHANVVNWLLYTKR